MKKFLAPMTIAAIAISASAAFAYDTVTGTVTSYTSGGSSLTLMNGQRFHLPFHYTNADLRKGSVVTIVYDEHGSGSRVKNLLVVTPSMAAEKSY